MRLALLLIALAGPAAAAPLASERAEADLACAAFLSWRADYGRPVEGADPALQSELFAAAMAAEADATGEDMLDLIQSLQDRMRVIQNAYQKAQTAGFATIDGLSVRAEDLGGLEARCAGDTAAAQPAPGDAPDPAPGGTVEGAEAPGTEAAEG